MSDYDMSIHSSTDAREWTDFFFKTHPNCNVDKETMYSWFANAMMAMHDNDEKLTVRQGLEEYKKGYAKAEEDLQIEKYLYKNYMDLLADTLEEVLDAWRVGESVEEAKALYDKARQILPKHR